MANQSGPFSTPAFIIKLYDILEEQNQDIFAHIIKWSDDGEYFIVLQPKLMEQEVLLQYFKHNHYQSFLRQLNMYEFLKARNSENHEVFSHPYFKRGQKKQLSLIKRNPIKTKCKQKKELKHLNKQSDFQRQMDSELMFLKQRQYKFETQFQDIINQNEQIMEQHKQIWNELGQSKKILDVKIDRISYLLSYILQQSDTSGAENWLQKNLPIKTELEIPSPMMKMMHNPVNWNLKMPNMNLSGFSPMPFFNEQNMFSPLALRSNENQESNYSSYNQIYQQFKEQ